MYKKTVLKNGLRIVFESIPYIRSVSLGIWVGVGSRNESVELSGISHFVEHMLFKGTKNRTAKQIAMEIDNIGGQLNAFTGKEYTCYYTKVLDKDIEIAMDVISDMIFNALLDEKDITTERNVIYEEIGMYEDYPEDMVHDILTERVWKNSPLGYPILGTFDSLIGIDSKALRSFIKKHYTPKNSVFSIVGNFDEDEMLSLVEKYFGEWDNYSYESSNIESASFNSIIEIKEKDIEQTHVCIGFESVEHGNDELYTILTINNIFGGGMSSRLFQNIREERGLAYSVYSFPSSYHKAGLFSIYAAVNPKQLEEVLMLIKAEIDLLVGKLITEHELETSKNQLIGNFLLGLESTGTKMNGIGKSELLLNRVTTTEEVIDKINRISMKDVKNIVSRYFNTKDLGVAIVGKVEKSFDIKDIFGINT